jgi:poly(3-hydroxybutyrate) depolymerase
VVIFLYGSGEAGSGSPADLEKVKRHGPAKAIASGQDICVEVNGKTECFIVISPQRSSAMHDYHVMELVDHILATYKADPARIYLTGLSMGGYSTYWAAGTELNSPNRFAALAPISASSNHNWSNFIGDNNIPVWHQHGDKDNTKHTYAKGLLSVEWINKRGCNPQARFTTHPGQGHSGGLWSKIYNPANSGNENLYRWFLSHKLNSVPAAPAPVQVKVTAGPDIQVDEVTKDLTIEGKVVEGEQVVVDKWWSQTSGPELSQCDMTKETLKIDEPEPGTYKLKFNAKDDNNKAYSDDMTLVVNEAGGYDIVVDNNDKRVSRTGSWTKSTYGGSGKYGDDYYHDNNAGKASKKVTYTIPVDLPGDYTISIYYLNHSNRSSKTPVEINTGNNVTKLKIDQTKNGKQWLTLGTYKIANTAEITISNEGTDGYVIADAVKLTYVGDTQADNKNVSSAIIIDNSDPEFSLQGKWELSTHGNGEKYGPDYYHDQDGGKGGKKAFYDVQDLSGSYEVLTKWTAHQNRASNTKVLVEHADGTDVIYLDQTKQVNGWKSLGTFDFSGDGRVVFDNAGSNGYVIADAVKFVPQQSLANARVADEPVADQVEVELLQTQALALYPNPVRDDLNLSINGQMLQNCTIKILDANGNQVLEQGFLSGSSSTVDLRNVKPGVYILQLHDLNNGQMAIKRFVKM